MTAWIFTSPLASSWTPIMENVQCFSPRGFLFQEQHCFIPSGLKYPVFVHLNITSRALSTIMWQNIWYIPHSCPVDGHSRDAPTVVSSVIMNVFSPHGICDLHHILPVQRTSDHKVASLCSSTFSAPEISPGHITLPSRMQLCSELMPCFHQALLISANASRLTF